MSCKSTLLEAVLVSAVAAGFAFAANELSPRGLNLSRDYFPTVAAQPKAPVKQAAPVANVNSTNSTTNSTGPPSTPATNETSEAAEIDQRIKDKGLHPVSRAEVERLQHDPRYLQGTVILVDARDAAHFADGHIPGAYFLDRFHAEKDLPGVLSACQSAEQVIVYCTGGDCEEAEETALFLRDAGVAIQKLFVYGGGYDDWSENHLPLEQGARNSGQIAGQGK